MTFLYITLAELQTRLDHINKQLNTAWTIGKHQPGGNPRPYYIEDERQQQIHRTRFNKRELFIYLSGMIEGLERKKTP